jgi:hypothetical protein
MEINCKLCDVKYPANRQEQHENGRQHQKVLHRRKISTDATKSNKHQKNSSKGIFHLILQPKPFFLILIQNKLRGSLLISAQILVYFLLFRLNTILY